MSDRDLMTTTVLGTPYASPGELRSRATFLALLWALSYPGEVQSLPAPESGASPDARTVCALVAETVLDLETSFYTPDEVLAAQLVRSGARSLPAPDAAYHFHPALTQPEALAQVAAARVGSYLYPDQAATLIVGCRLGNGVRLRLRGPGVQGEAEVLVGSVPAAFWSLRDDKATYPLGWDIFLVDGLRVVGLPRTTVIRLDEAVQPSGEEA